VTRTARTFSLAIAVLVLSVGTSAQREEPSSWASLQFLVGTWVSAGTNELGSANGTATFAEEVNRSVLVRRSFAAYTMGPEKGTRHDDLMIIYRDAPDAPPRAIYFDSEGHVIRYTVSVPSDHIAVFESEPGNPGPRYRLSYSRSGTTLTGRFEIAPPPHGDYKTYLSWTSVKQ
jgi:hypothetical protein